MTHDETARMHGNQHTKMMDAPFAINAMHSYVRQPPSRITQRILNGTPGTDTHHFIAQRTQGTRTGGLADSNNFKELPSCKWAVAGQLQVQCLSMGRHG